ncbi:P-loop containing nucleoside triphosphate hydrolase protein [Hesseltinella vesiculosa]|uniref:DNA 3'-5' helicase n=1 Tax=Hesseltinella vesiculosa TaxID=101127 RepID=A0A1X2GRR4_9FUNG|nr:P-loop containing nucleoside triphosphate hydrolase protein [Hesseltinella vesiculosa]
MTKEQDSFELYGSDDDIFTQLDQDAIFTLDPTHGSDRTSNPMDRIPKAFRTVFNFKTFNEIQAIAFDRLFTKDQSIVISAPTGTGKSALLELAMVRCFMTSSLSVRMVYMAPTKALCAQKAEAWNLKFKPLGYLCNVTTPEVWAGLTRCWKEHADLAQSVKLFMVLRQSRGADLEVCVSRIQNMNPLVRFVAVSAIIPNMDDVCQWLNATPLTFSEDYRSIKVQSIVCGVEKKHYFSMASFDKYLDSKLFQIIQQHSDGKPVIVFCPTRASVESACATLESKLAKRRVSDFQVNHPQLKKCLSHGIGFHHAGLDANDRRLVETLFRNQTIRIVATTPTLATGFNLPAFLVIIKSTVSYQEGFLEEACDVDVLQMIGRAGRPGLEAAGRAVILTTDDKQKHYKDLVTCNSVVESSLHHCLSDHFLSEIRNECICDEGTFIKWFKSSFLYLRLKKNPTHYLLLNNRLGSTSLEASLHQLFTKETKRFTKYGLVKKEPRLTISDLGIVMDTYGIKLDTMIHILNALPMQSMSAVLNLVSQGEEFKMAHAIRIGQKKLLTTMANHIDLKFPNGGKLNVTADKIAVTIQCLVGKVNIFEHGKNATTTGLLAEGFAILKIARRINRCKRD